MEKKTRNIKKKRKRDLLGQWDFAKKEIFNYPRHKKIKILEYNFRLVLF